MNILQYGFGRFGRKIAASFPSNLGTLYVTDKSFEDKLPDEKDNFHIVKPSLVDTTQFNAVYIATPRHTQIDIIKQIPKHISILVEKPAIGDTLDFKELSVHRSLNTIAVGHTFLQCGGFQYIKKQCMLGSSICIYANRDNLNGPIRNDTDCYEDLATHDVALFWDIAKSKFGANSYKEAELKPLYKNRFNYSFNLSIRNLHADICGSWISLQKNRGWAVNFNNESLLWDGDKDVVFSDFNGHLYNKDNASDSTLTSQWKQLIKWAESNKSLDGINLHSLEDAFAVQYMMEKSW